MSKHTFENTEFSLSLFEELQKKNISYIHIGNFDREVTDAVISLTEKNLQTEEESSKMKKKIFAIMVESIQNITRHQTADDNEDDLGLFIIKKSNDRYYITTGNSIEKDSIPTITELIQNVNVLDKDELKAYYKKILNEGELSEKGGAGIGFIDMARKSGNKLSYKFIDLNNSKSYFYFQTIPSLVNISENFNTEAENSLSNIIETHNILKAQKVRLVFNGIMNQENLNGLLDTIENNNFNSESTKKKLFYIVMEMLQNIVKHGSNPNEEHLGNIAMFILSETEGGYLLTSGNYIKSENEQVLANKIEYINQLKKKDELEKYYDEILFNFENDNPKNSGLGFIDLRLKSGNKLKPFFKKLNNGYSYYSLQVRI